MELLKLSWISIFIYCHFGLFLNCEFLEILRKNSLMCNSLDKFIEIVRVPKMTTFDIISQINNEQTEKALDCVKELIIKNNFAFTTVTNIQQVKSSSSVERKRSHVVIILDSKESLKAILQKMTPNSYNYHGHYLIILTQKSIEDFDSWFDFFWRSFIYNVNILIEINESVEMFTFYPFARGKMCHDTKSVKINEYTNGTWANKSFFPPKLKNFHQCRLKAACYEFGPSALRTIQINGSISLNGSDVEILKGLAEVLNFDLEINILTNLGSWGQVWENGSAVGAFKSIIDGETDIIANFYYLTDLRSRYMQFTRAYYSLSLMMMIPKSAPLTPLQKLFRPFKPRVWIFFCGLFFAALIAVAIIKCRSKSVQLLFFDRNIYSPVIEMLVILFGGSQHALPKKNFSRLLLMSFALFCFVFRTIYTGSLYKFLQVSVK